jgi:hypothetical protein
MNFNIKFLICLSTIFIVVSISDLIFFRSTQISSNTRSLCNLTGLCSPVWSVSWHEPRIRRYINSNNYSPYPEFPPADRLGFIYRTNNEP